MNYGSKDVGRYVPPPRIYEPDEETNESNKSNK